MRTASINATGLIAFKSPRDATQLKIIAAQMDGGENWRATYEAYKCCTRRPFHFLFLDFSPTCCDMFRLRSNIITGEPMECFVPN